MKNLSTLKPDEVVAQILKKIRELFGDEAQNESTVFASHGYYYISVAGQGSGSNRILRRQSLPAFFKEMKTWKQ